MPIPDPDEEPTPGRHALPRARAWTPAAVRAVLIALLGLGALVTWWWWQGRPLPVEQAPPAMEVVVPGQPVGQSGNPGASPAAEAVDLTVHVVGRVRRPGVYRLAPGSRVIDAIEAAGGLRPGAGTGRLNLARPLVDGEQVHVGPGAPVGLDPGGAPPPGPPGAAAPTAPLDLNTASAAELEELPGIGPVLAGRIVAWRDANGPFPSVDVLGEVSGIGPVVLENLRPLVTV